MLEECAHTASRLLGMGAVGRHDLGRAHLQPTGRRPEAAGSLLHQHPGRYAAGRIGAYARALAAGGLGRCGASAASPCGRPGLRDRHAADGRLSADRGRTGAAVHGSTCSPRTGEASGSTRANAPENSDDSDVHQALVEHTLFGADVVPAAIHLTAATLAAMSPSVGFTQMQLHSLIMGVDAVAGIRLGSLDWLAAPKAQSSFSATLEQIGATGSAGSLVESPRADVVISNPPFTRRGSDGGKGEALARVLDLPAGDAEAQRAVARRTSALLKGTPANQMAGHAASFTVLADRLVKSDGRLALVLPVTALAGQSWRQVRAMLAARYEIELVVSSHDSELRSMSYDTHIAEVLLVARRLREDERPSGRGGFVNLWRAPRRETDALALANAINAAAAYPLHRSDGPPIGGSPLFVGGEQWGELLNGPVDDGPWTASRWKLGQTGQFAAALERGELWSADGSRVVAQIPMAKMADVCLVGPARPSDSRVAGRVRRLPRLGRAGAISGTLGTVTEGASRSGGGTECSAISATGPRPRTDLVAGRDAAGDARC